MRPAKRLRLCQHLVDPAARVGKDLRHLVDLRGIAGSRGLHRRSDELESRVAKLRDALGHLPEIPRVRSAGPLAALLELLAAGIGERIDPLAVPFLSRHETFVLEHLERRIDRAGARAPNAAASLLEVADHVVAVERLL